MSGLVGLVGRTLAHSWSPEIHAAFGCADYRLFELEPEELEGFFRNPGLRAVNVTIPYKCDVMRFCGALSPGAEAIGSVNTVVRGADGVLRGFNTDLYGFRAMTARAGIPLAGKKVLILGSGGASRTARAAAAAEGAREIVGISRSGPDNYDNLSRHADADVVVNATPVGMYPANGAAPADLSLFPRLCGVVDLIYNPRRTALLLQAEALGIPRTDGLSMLVAQAAEAEGLFFGRRPDGDETERVLAGLARRRTNLVLIGMPGCGKSTVGARLAALSGRELVDTDERIAAEAGTDIPTLFARYGEADFRERERRAVAEAGKRTGIVLVTGGGAVKTPANRDALRQNGRIYHLERELDRLPSAGRPLSQRSTAAVLWAQRAPLYAAWRDAAADNNGAPEETAQAIWRDFCEHTGA